MNINQLEQADKEKKSKEIMLRINMKSCEELRSIIENMLSIMNPSQVDRCHHYICGDK